MKFATSLRTAQEFLEQLADKLNTKVVVDCQRSSFQLPRRIGQGEIIVYSISDGLDALIIEADFKHDFEVIFNKSDNVPVSFLTLASGLFSQILPDTSEEDLILEPLQSAICAYPADSKTTWSFARQRETCFIAIFMHREAFLSNVDCGTLEIPADLLETVKDIAGKSNFLFQEIFHLPLVTALREIIQQEDIGLLNSTFAVAKIYEMVFFQLQQYSLHVSSVSTSTIKPDQGLALIRNAETILITRLQDPPNIPELAKMAGLNQQALKKGFKQLFGETINQYLNTKRLEQAEILIKSGNLKLQDVAMEVGYNNPSYFSRRFKEKYGVTPRYYANQVKTEDNLREGKGSRSTDE